MLFNWSKKEKKPLCFHEWRIADVYESWARMGEGYSLTVETEGER